MLAGRQLSPLPGPLHNLDVDLYDDEDGTLFPSTKNGSEENCLFDTIFFQHACLHRTHHNQTRKNQQRIGPSV